MRRISDDQEPNQPPRDDQRLEREEQINSAFHNLYWIKIISLQMDPESSTIERWSLKDDINECLQALQEMNIERD